MLKKTQDYNISLSMTYSVLGSFKLNLRKYTHTQSTSITPLLASDDNGIYIDTNHVSKI